MFGKGLHVVASRRRGRRRRRSAGCSTAGSMPIERIEQITPSLEDVFVSLIEARDRAEQPQAGGAAMKLRRTWAVARKEFLHVLRDFRSLAMAVAMPALLLTLFGYALTLDVDNVPLAVWDQSGTARSREFISRFAGSRYFFRTHVRQQLRGPGAGDRHAASVMMGLVVPRDFAQQLGAGRDAPVQLLVDGSDSNTATIAIGYARRHRRNLRAGPQHRAKPARHGGSRPTIPLDVRPRVWFNEELDSRNYIIPGLIAVIMMVIAAMLTSLTVAREWERGTMEQLISTPVKAARADRGQAGTVFRDRHVRRRVGGGDGRVRLSRAPARQPGAAVRHVDDLPGGGPGDGHR